MDIRDVLIELFGRVDAHVRDAVDGLTLDELVTAPEPGGNTIAWLVWHLTRVQDHHVAELRGADQLWVTGDWAHRFGRSGDPHDTGYGHSREEAAAVRPDRPETLVRYYDAVAAGTRRFLSGLTEADLDRVVDSGWDPPVTTGVRLVSVADDDIQHAGQARYLRGLFARRRATT